MKIEMHFLPDIYVPCDLQGQALQPGNAGGQVQGDKNISDVLEMTVEEACVFFANIPKIARKLQTLQEVGLLYSVRDRQRFRAAKPSASSLLANELASP